MKILSEPRKDVRHSDHQSGGYEWWYFDALSDDGKYAFVVIFYEGNPFSTRYNAAVLEEQKPMPADYPAISISVYEDGAPIYYSFTEFEKKDCDFSSEIPSVTVGPHQMKKIGEQKLEYRLTLGEALPSGDRLKAKIHFASSGGQLALFDGEDSANTVGHVWNLVQPRAEVIGEFEISVKNEGTTKIKFQGRGYHDHNTGNEPMRDEFTDWYWGRVHFDYATLVYYVMNRQNQEQHRAWLIDAENSRVLETFEAIEIADRGLTLFGLKTARKIGLRSGSTQIQIQLSTVLDNGPFYQRYQSDAFLRVADRCVTETQSGISEYIYPNRIFTRLFWPFVDMRIRYKDEKPHWVQRSKKLYRWTW